MPSQNKLSDIIVTPDNLKTDMELAEKSGDIRMFILYANLYNEYFVNKIFELVNKEPFKKCACCNKFLVPKFKQQVGHLANLKIVDEKNGHIEILNLIYDLRCELLHNLKCDTKELETVFNKKHQPVIDDIKGLMEKFLKKATTWEKIKLAVFATTTRLYHEYERLNNRTPTQFLYFLINPEASGVQIVIDNNSEPLS